MKHFSIISVIYLLIVLADITINFPNKTHTTYNNNDNCWI